MVQMKVQKTGLMLLAATCPLTLAAITMTVTKTASTSTIGTSFSGASTVSPSTSISRDASISISTGLSTASAESTSAPSNQNGWLTINTPMNPLMVCSPYNITWTSGNVTGYFSLEAVSVSNNQEYPIFSYVDVNQGAYMWNVSVVPGSYYFRGNLTGYPVLLYSGNFVVEAGLSTDCLGPMPVSSVPLSYASGSVTVKPTTTLSTTTTGRPATTTTNPTTVPSNNAGNGLLPWVSNSAVVGLILLGAIPWLL